MEIYLPIADTAVNIVALLSVGFSTGMLSGLYGIGGGIIMVPLMILIGIPPHIAVGTSSSIITGTSFSGSLYNLKKSIIHFPIAIVLLCGSLVGAKTGLSMFAHFKDAGNLNTVINLSYIAILSIAALTFYTDAGLCYIKNRRNKKTQSKTENDQPSTSKYFPLIAMVGFIAGNLSAIMGIGGAIILVPTLTYICRIPFNKTAATALLQSLFMSIFITFIQSTQHQAVDIILCITVLISSVIGVQFGSRLALILPTVMLKLSMAIIVSMLCIRFLKVTFSTPSSAFMIG